MHHHLFLIPPNSFCAPTIMLLPRAMLDTTPSLLITRKSILSTSNYLIPKNPTSRHRQYINIDGVRLRGPTVYYDCQNFDLGHRQVALLAKRSPRFRCRPHAVTTGRQIFDLGHQQLI